MGAFETKLRKLFAQYELLLNDKVTKMELQKTDDGHSYFEAVVPTLTDGGATLIVDSKPESISLVTPAKAEFTQRKVVPARVVYRIAFDIADAAKAGEDDAYFNLLVPKIVKQAIDRYTATFGPAETIRYGVSFCTLGSVITSGEYVEMRLEGLWASDTSLEVK